MKLTDLKINKANPRLIRDERYKKLIQSLKEFPKMLNLRPIVIDDDGTILGGNMRYRALLDLGYKEVPDNWIKKASELTDKEKKRFIIADNVEMGEWDTELLSNNWEIEELKEWGMEIPSFEYENKEKELSEQETKNECPKCGYKW